MQFLISEAQFLIPDWGDKDSPLQPYAKVDFIPQSGTKNLATVILVKVSL
jgi:hypothetical protein